MFGLLRGLGKLLKMDSQRSGTAQSSSNTAFAEVFLRDGKPVFAGQKTATLGTRVAGRDPDSGQGVFARWQWDGSRLTAQVDRYGFFSLFYCEDGGGIRLSPSLLQLAARGCALKPDHRALAVFHRLGIFINDDTPFEGIRVLPPGGTLTWENGRLTIEAPELAVKPNRISRAEAVDGFIELFRASMARTLEAWDGPIVLPLSGGRDSRHILLELVHQGRKPDACITFQHTGDQWNAEVKAARAIAEAVGVRHDVLGRERSRQIDTIRAIALTELCADEHAQMMPLHDYLIGRGAASYDGINGDVLTEGADNPQLFQELFHKGDFATIARMMMDGHGTIISASGNPRGASALYSPSPDTHEEAVAYVAGAIARFGNFPDPNQAFWMFNRTRREINFVARGILSPAEAVFTPYLDEDLVEFCLGLPFGVKFDGIHFHDETMFKAWPQYRDVPFENGFADDPPKSTRIAHKLQSAVDMARVAQFLAPGAPLAEYRALFGRGRPLNPGPNAMYHLHNRLVETLDAKRARALMAFTQKLNDTRTRRLVSDSYRPSRLH